MTRADYFHKTPLDEAFYRERLQLRMPREIVDAHLHVSLPAHSAGLSRESIRNDWALQCGVAMPHEKARYYWSALAPDARVELLALPLVHPDADIPANNAYLAGLAGAGGLSALMAVRPEWEASRCERELEEGGFAGFKPYPYMASRAKGAEVGIFDFLPRAQLDVLQRRRAAVLIHLPRAGRLADDDNAAELKAMVDGWPDVRVVVAHFGRAFNPKVLDEGARKLGDYARALHWDCSAVLNPEVYAIAFDRLDRDKILFGSDLPILRWHGRRRWTENAYRNLCREDFPWNAHEEGAAAEARYVFFLYEQLNNILDGIARTGDGALRDKLFAANARRVYRLSK